MARLRAGYELAFEPTVDVGGGTEGDGKEQYEYYKAYDHRQNGAGVHAERMRQDRAGNVGVAGHGR